MSSVEPTPPSFDLGSEEQGICQKDEVNTEIKPGENINTVKKGNTTIVPIDDKTLYNKDKKIDGLIRQLSSYTSVQGNEEDREKLKNKEREPIGLGTLSGVYFPTIQNIFGVILFIRLPWIVGLAGIWQALLIVGFCCLTTFLTAISMSAIATNGKIPAGGSYFMISRSLGPGFGGAVGMQFYLATTVASAMYILGAVEILTIYILPSMSIGSLASDSRFYGTIFLILMCSIVFVGVKYVNKSAGLFLLVTLIAIVTIFISFFVSASGYNQSSVVCMYGDVLVDRPSDGYCGKYLFNETLQLEYDGLDDREKKPSPLLEQFCGKWDSDVENDTYVDECFEKNEFAKKAPVWNRFGILGLGNMKENWNLGAHWRDMYEPITIPELRDNDLQTATDNFAVCDAKLIEKGTGKFKTNGDEITNFYCGENNDQWKLIKEVEEKLNSSDYITEANYFTLLLTQKDITDPEEYKTQIFTELADLDVSPEAKHNKAINKEDYKTFTWVVADLTSSLMIMIGIFFPSVTGIMAGSNRSGDLADGAKSIPLGTVCAIATTSISYLLFVILFGLCTDAALMQDKFGEALAVNKDGGGELLTAVLCRGMHPVFEYIMIYGAFLSTTGAGLQSLTGAPRLLQSIAKDDLVPRIGFLAKGRGEGNEPTWAVLVTFCISFCAIMIANLDLVAPILTIFFLMCYLFVNLSTALCSLIKAPSWRPSFKYYHWSLSLLGAGCCLTLIFLTSVWYALASFVIAGFIYFAIGRYGAQKEWGDSVKGLHMSMAISSLKRYGANISTHTKNWRPQILLLNKLDRENTEVKYPQLLTFVNALKEGKGLLIIKTFIDDNYDKLAENGDLEEIQEKLSSVIKGLEIEAIDNSIVVTSNCSENIHVALQATGLSGLRPNTYCLNFPTVMAGRSYDFFYSVLRHATAAKCSLLVTKGIDKFPAPLEKKTFFRQKLETMTQKSESGTVDVWWIRQDGGIILLLAHLLLRNQYWKNYQLRIFVTAEPGENSVEMKRVLQDYLRSMRISSEVEIVEIDTEEVEPFMSDNKSNNIFKAKGLEKDVDVVMKKARQSVMNPKTQPRVSNIPASFSGTWSGANQSEPIAPRSTVLKKMHEAGGLNKKILEHSSTAELVFVTMPPIPAEHNTEKETNYVRYLDAMTRGLQRVVLVRSTGNEVITMYN